MSRTIDLSKALSDEDAAYLLARGREQEVTRNLAEFGDDPDAKRAAAYIPGTSVDQADGVLDTPGADPLVNNGGGVVDGETPTFQTPANQVVQGEAGDAGVGALQVNSEQAQADPEAEDYLGEEWSKEKLLAEIERRNAEYSEDYQLAKGGSKKQMAARLVADDNTPEDEDEDEDEDENAS